MSVICPKNKITLSDIFIIGFSVLAVVLSVIIPLTSKSSSYIEIITDTKIEKVSLDKDTTIDITSNGHSYILEIKERQAHILEADCPDLTCTKTAPIGNRQGSVICVPGKLVIRTITEGGAEDEADIVVP